MWYFMCHARHPSSLQSWLLYMSYQLIFDNLIVNFCFVVNSAVQTDISDIVLGKGQSHNYDKYKMTK